MAARVFVTGIGADVGKTLVSAILAEAFQADYWKPVQAGNLGFTDSDVVRSLVSNQKSKVHPEAHRLKEGAAAWEALSAGQFGTLQLPRTSNGLIVEGLGGVLAPVSNEMDTRGLISQFNLPVLLVARNYLGSVNHTMLSIEALQSKNVSVAGIIFNGEQSSANENYIRHHAEVPLLARVGVEEMIDQLTVKRYAAIFRESLSSIWAQE